MDDSWSIPGDLYTANETLLLFLVEKAGEDHYGYDKQ